METNEKAFLTQQLICMLPSLAVKVIGYLLNWQKYDIIKYFPKQMCGFMHITENELELALQTLEDNKLINISKIDGQYAIQLDKKVIMSYINVPMQKVHDHDGFKLATEVKWNAEDKNDDLDIASMSDEQLERIIKELQRRKKEKKGCSVIYPEEVDGKYNDLPF